MLETNYDYDLIVFGVGEMAAEKEAKKTKRKIKNSYI